jgi:hypothetical protein
MDILHGLKSKDTKKWIVVICVLKPADMISGKEFVLIFEMVAG